MFNSSHHSDVLGSHVHKSENTITYLHLLNLLHIMHPADALIICSLFILLPQTKPNVTSLAASKKMKKLILSCVYSYRIWNLTTLAKVRVRPDQELLKSSNTSRCLKMFAWGDQSSWRSQSRRSYNLGDFGFNFTNDAKKDESGVFLFILDWTIYEANRCQ